MLQIVDAQWKDHLYSLDHLKEGIGLRGYGQRDPLVEYKKESFELFQGMKDRIDEEMVRYLWRLRPVMAERRTSGGRAEPPVRRGAARRVDERRERGGRRDGPRRDARGRGAGPRPAGRRRRRRGREDRATRRAEDRPQRPVPVRQRQEVQEVPRSVTWT